MGRGFFDFPVKASFSLRHYNRLLLNVYGGDKLPSVQHWKLFYMSCLRLWGVVWTEGVMPHGRRGCL